jgi:hypothetical protein
MPERETDPIQIKREPSLQQQVRQIAEKEDSSFSSMVRIFMREGVAKRRDLLTASNQQNSHRSTHCQSFPAASSR